jgi:DNA repair protein RecN (Recombination protein N)
MLRSLSIRNVVLISRLDIDFEAGFGVLTGETGAGKSILLDSLGLVLGKRAETSLIRQGEDKLTVSANFDYCDNAALKALLAENDIDYDGDILIRRSLMRNGTGKIFFNDQPISAKLLKEIGKYLVEVHGQFDNQGLLNAANHLSVLDGFGGYGDKLRACAESFGAYREAVRQLETAEADLAKAQQDEENLRHWVKELENIAPKVGEFDTLQARRQELMHAEKIIENLNYAYSALTQGADVTSALRAAQNGVDKANTYTSGHYDEIYGALDRALIEVSEALDEIEAASSDVALNAGEQEAIDSRIFALKDLARKHGVEVEALADTLADFKNKLAGLESGTEGLAVLRQDAQSKRLAYLENAKILHEARVEAAGRLDKAVTAELPPLKMDKARFETMLTPKAESSWSALGTDEVCFCVATNPNSPLGPLSKIASGGELARLMLALKVNLAASSAIATMIFDEVDAGVGGAVAQAVGERLARLGKSVQVLVVTHAPQVAALGTSHFKVAKTTENNVTTTEIHKLSQAERQEEIARMLAGETISDEARAAALKLMK